jgi:hypothetical protein
MKILKKPLDYVVKQLQSKRFHVKSQKNRKAYDRMKIRKEIKKSLDESFSLYRVKSLFYIYREKKFFFREVVRGKLFYSINCVTVF